MSEPMPNRPDFSQDLFREIRFNSALEDLAFRRIEEGDLSGARAAFGMLVERLNLAAPSAEYREAAALLLVEILLEANRRTHGGRSKSTYWFHRGAILESFAGSLDPEDVRRRFLPGLDRILARSAGREVAPGEHLVDRAKSLVRIEYAQPLSLARISVKLETSPGYLSRMFRRETGSTLTSYIHRVRLQHALLLLAAGGRSLSEVSVLVGYQSYRDFYRNFTKHEKASPRQARHRLATPFG